MAEFHFVEDYEKHVEDLHKSHNIDDAMSLAVGGSFDAIGKIEAAILLKYGLKDGAYLGDVGCGSGRTAAAVCGMLDIKLSRV